MSRTSKVTFTASAVTLTCLAAALYASPVVVAESMGRQVEAYSPMKHSTFSTERQHGTIQAKDADTTRDETTTTNDGTWQTVESELGPTEPSGQATTDSASVDTAATQNTAPPAQKQPTNTPTDAETSRVTSEVPRPKATPTASPSDKPSEASDDTPEPSEDSVPEDLESPDSITVIVNKLRALPADFTPEDLVELPTELTGGNQQRLREEAAEAVEAMFKAAQDDGVELQVISSFRSFDYQQRLYDNYRERYGADNTDAMSARPGHSEHQTGLALDVDTPGGEHSLKTSFGETEAGQWLADHAHEYGLVVRYPEDQHDTTGFQYEPWHLRYFGEQYATQIVENTGVAEEEFGLESAPDYAG